MNRTVVVNGGQAKYVQNIFVGRHTFQADEPLEAGGLDAGPNPYELLLAALGACASITVRMYAERKQWPLREVHAGVSYARVHADDCANCDGELTLSDGMQVTLSFVGDLSPEQRARLVEIAGKCPVHRSLSRSIPIQTQAADSPSTSSR